MPISSNGGCWFLRGASLVALVLSFAAHGADSAKTPVTPAAARASWVKPDIDALPNDEWGRTVRHGRDLITKTASLIGPEVANPAHRFSGNNLNCQSCHLEAGTKQFGLPFQGVYADFPNYRARSGLVSTMEDRIQGCMVRSMNGKPLPLEGPEMTALVAYMKFLSTGRPVGAATLGRGPGTMPELDHAADPVRGGVIYAGMCAACHGNAGQGQRAGRVGDMQGYAIPPLWGMDSFNNGAGMNRLILTANFIHNNMPNGTTWRQPSLSTEDAWNVAAFINAQPRPHMAQLDRDFPNRLQKPVDTAYGPYADNMKAQQHKLGPFAPIREAVRKLKDAQSNLAPTPSEATE